MVMHPRIGAKVIDALESLVPAQISNERVDDAARRILAMKCEMGLFDPGRFDREAPPDPKRLGEVGSEVHRRLAREAVRKSLVLLKNERAVLPLAKDLPSVLVVGRSADNLGYQSGGWTIEWQGASGPITIGTTILEGIRRAVSPKT